MIEKLAFALFQYSLLGVFVAAAFGLGQPLAGWLAQPLGLSPFITIPLRIASGMGVMVVVLFVAGILGHLNAVIVALLMLIGLGFAIVNPIAGASGKNASGRIFQGLRMPKGAWLWIGIVAISSLPLLIKPLQPPSAFDELSYHLPYARFWASEGALTINEWLRYPLLAFNMELLYAAAMTFDNDVLPHLLHALTGALTAVLTFGVARRYMDWRVGLGACIALLFATGSQWGTAYVDLGSMFFWSCAFASLALRYEHGDARFSYMAALFAGIAVGTKYQALFFVPVFAVLALTVERRPAIVLKSVLLFIATGGFWYLRNFLISGDPLHPLAGHLVGFWLWNADDLVIQHSDLDRVRNWPAWFLLPAVGVILFWRELTPIQRGLVLTTISAVAIWYLISGFPRYLFPIYPMLAVLSTYTCICLFRRIGLNKRMSSSLARPWVRAAILPTLLLVVSAIAPAYVRTEWSRVAADVDSRTAYLSHRFAGYALLRSAESRHIGTLYQLGFEGELYYLGDSVRGDWFGPGRYGEVMRRSGDARALSQYLRNLGTDSLLINLQRGFVTRLRWDPALPDYFDLVAQSQKAALYQLKAEW